MTKKTLLLLYIKKAKLIENHVLFYIYSFLSFCILTQAQVLSLKKVSVYLKSSKTHFLTICKCYFSKVKHIYHSQLLASVQVTTSLKLSSPP